MTSGTTHMYGQMARAARLRTYAAAHLVVAGTTVPASPMHLGTRGNWSLKPASPVAVCIPGNEFAGSHAGITDRPDPRPTERSP